jgi:hypothetical protein
MIPKFHQNNPNLKLSLSSTEVLWEVILAHPQLWSKSLPPIWRVDLRLGEVTKWSPHSLSLMLKSPKASAGEIRVFSLFCPPSPS